MYDAFMTVIVPDRVQVNDLISKYGERMQGSRVPEAMMDG